MVDRLYPKRWCGETILGEFSAFRDLKSSAEASFLKKRTKLRYNLILKKEEKSTFEIMDLRS